MPLKGAWLEVAPFERLVSTDAFAAGWQPQGPFMLRIDSFAPEDGGTRNTATARHWTAQARDDHRARCSDAGWNAAADQPDAVAKRLAGG